MSPELKVSKDGESLGNAVKDVVWSRDTTGGGRDGAEIDAVWRAKKQLLSWFCCIPWLSVIKRQLESEGGEDLGERQQDLRECLEMLERQLSKISSRAELRDVTSEN